jgi:hypothetical protein
MKKKKKNGVARNYYQFTMLIDVQDKRALIKAARKHPDGDASVKTVEQALVVLIDPSTLPGCEIMNSESIFAGPSCSACFVRRSSLER